MGKQRIFQLLQTLKDLQEVELRNAAKIYTVAHIATGVPVGSIEKPNPKTSLK